MTTTPIEKFQSLLRELFQFDCADLDFGIYRIMNHKRAVIDRWIEEELPKTIEQELHNGVLAELGQAQKALQTARQRVLDALGENALDADGNLAEPYHNTKAGKEYLEAQTKAQGTHSTEALEAAVYNHLYTFFSRYWQDGDFISKRRYSKKERYAIPYNGEEVTLYWANYDQYYIKTGEYFTDYSYKAPNGVNVHFKLLQADVEQNNVKGEKRFFVPVLHGVAWDSAVRTLTIPFEFRPLTAQENIAYGQKNQQEAIIAKAAAEILGRVKAAEALAALTAERHAPGNADDSPNVSLLEYHLHQYTHRNTSDFFIHKDLKGFLSRELDFYLKNEVLNLEEMKAAGEAMAEGWFQLMRLIKRVGDIIIEFLAQIEDFQKMLWEKKKFVTETFYVVTVRNIPETFYPEIAACEAQWAEWETLLLVEEEQPNLFTAGKGRQEKRFEYLKTHPTLMLDTCHFSQDFTDRLLASFDNLDEMTDGLLVHSENWQALNLLQEKYRERVKCTYIDPPYNSKTTEIMYKNDYKNSSWLSLMRNRLLLSKKLSSIDGSHVIAIDENEQEVLGQLLSDIFKDFERVCVVVIHNKKGIQGNYFSYNHEYAYFCISTLLPEVHGQILPNVEWKYANLRKWGRESKRETAKNCFYPIYVKNSNIVGFGAVCDKDFHPGNANVESDDRIAVYPIDSKGIERKWRYARNTIEKIGKLLKINITHSGEIQIFKAMAEKQPKTVWDDSKYIAGDYGTKWLTDLNLKVKEDLYPKSVYTVKDSIYSVSEPDSLILDYFAGSGTTSHAVINLNREDGGRRSFLLVEMAQYFDTVLLPRIKKITFAPEWKDGDPKRMANTEEAKRSPRIIKVIRLESYEDTLNNLTFDDESGQKALELFKDDYLLHYMLQWETRDSKPLLDVEKLQAPFSYKLRLNRDGETRERPVDLAETFNYLLGLDVQTRKVYDANGRRYLVYRGSLRNGRAIAVIWRETQGWTKEDYEHDRDFAAAQGMTAGADEIFVNGDSLIPGGQSLDPIFKARMFEGVEA